MLCFVLAHQCGGGGAPLGVATQEVNSAWSSLPMPDRASPGFDATPVEPAWTPPPALDFHTSTYSSGLISSGYAGVVASDIVGAPPGETRAPTMSSYADGFNLNIESMASVPKTPLLGARAFSSGVKPAGEDQEAAGEHYRNDPELGHEASKHTDGDAANAASAEWMQVYLARVDEILFRLSDSARSSPQQYFEMVMAFRSEYGYQMQSATVCPSALQQVITLSTHPDPAERPAFAELARLLYNF